MESLYQKYNLLQIIIFLRHVSSLPFASPLPAPPPDTQKGTEAPDGPGASSRAQGACCPQRSPLGLQASPSCCPAQPPSWQRSRARGQPPPHEASSPCQLPMPGLPLGQPSSGGGGRRVHVPSLSLRPRNLKPCHQLSAGLCLWASGRPQGRSDRPRRLERGVGLIPWPGGLLPGTITSPVFNLRGGPSFLLHLGVESGSPRPSQGGPRAEAKAVLGGGSRACRR